jgi:capsular polysaccharide biosynthesis protein
LDFLAYVKIIWSRKNVFSATAAAALIVVILWTVLTPATYEAAATLRVETNPGGSLGSVNITYADRLMNTYVLLATSTPVLDEMKLDLGLSKSPVIKAEIVPNTELIRISVDSIDPKIAMKAANLAADILIQRITDPQTMNTQTNALESQLATAEKDLQSAQAAYIDAVLHTPEDSERILSIRNTIDAKQNAYDSLVRQLEQSQLQDALRAKSIYIVEPATVPSAPVKPRVALNLSFGFLVAIIGGIAAAMVIENIAPRKSSTPVIRKIPLSENFELFSSAGSVSDSPNVSPRRREKSSKEGKEEHHD